MTQLVLDLGDPPAPSFANFVPGPSAEAAQALRRLAEGARDARFVYLWGPSGSGRSHLLQAARSAAETGGGAVRGLGPDAPLAAFAFDPQCRLWLIDDCDRLDEPRQLAAFHLFNAIQADPRGALAAAGARPPAALALVDELRTRLGWGLVLQLQPLGDADKAAALERTVRERGIVASADLIPYLLTHVNRDMASLRATIDALDRFALQEKRPLTLPLLREFLQRRFVPTCGGR